MWDANLQNGEMKPSTVEVYKRSWRYYLESDLRDIPINDFSVVDASNLLDKLAAKLNAHTLAHVRAVAHNIFSHARIKGVIAFNPFKDVKLAVKPRRPENYVAFTPQQVHDVLNGLQGNLQAMTTVGLAYFCALRPGEVTAAKWENYSGTHLTITESNWKGHIGTPKTTASAQTIPVPGPMREILNRFHEQEGRPTTGLILHGLDHNRPLNLDHFVRNQIAPMLKLKKIPWHALKYFRNDAASHITDATGDSGASAALLRHKSLQTTDAFYSKIMNGAKDRAVSVLESEFTGAKLLAA